MNINQKKAFYLMIFALLIFFLVGLALFVGLYEDEEFGNKYLFIKLRPILKFYFDRPLTIGDNRTFESLSETEKINQKLYDEFIIAKNGIKRSIYITR